MIKQFFIILLLVCKGMAVERNNVIIVTLDGMRWQELFMGASYDQGTKGTTMSVKHVTREELFNDFFWEKNATNVRYFGNRRLNSSVSMQNKELWSLPGYVELLTGAVNSRVKNNMHEFTDEDHAVATIHKFLADEWAGSGEVLEVASWDVFERLQPASLRGSVNAGYSKNTLTCHPLLRWAQECAKSSFESRELQDRAEVRFDHLTFSIFLDLLQRKRPRFAHLSLDDPDRTGHHGKNYASYVGALRSADKTLAALWQFLQSDPFYRSNTTLFVTSDHGRGSQMLGEMNWRNHGDNVPDSSQVWVYVRGVGVGEGKLEARDTQLQQTQVAATIADLLGKRKEFEQLVPVRGKSFLTSLQ